MRIKNIFILLVFLSAYSTFAQIKSKAIQGTWHAGKTLMDPKVGVIKLIRSQLDDMKNGTFLHLEDSTKMSLYYSPMCGNDCIWNYGGNFGVDQNNKLTLKFNTYMQHGFCKSISKSYKKPEMNFVFKIEQRGEDTLILKRVTK